MLWGKIFVRVLYYTMAALSNIIRLTIVTSNIFLYNRKIFYKIGFLCIFDIDKCIFTYKKMEKKNILWQHEKGTESFRRKTDIFYWNPFELLELAKSGGVTIEELKEFLIQIKKPGKVERTVIELTNNVEVLVMKIIEEQAEEIDCSILPLGESEWISEDFIPKEELLQRELVQLKEKMSNLFVLETDILDPSILERGDVLDVQFFYKKQDVETKFTIVFSVSGMYSAKVKGECFVWDFHESGKVIMIPFSMAITDKIYQKWQRPLNVFHNGNFVDIPQFIRGGLHERYITSIQILSREEKKISKEGLLSRLLWWKK